jgi:hypothetical protein
MKRNGESISSITMVQRIGELVTANVPASLSLLTVLMKAIRSSKQSVLTRATRRQIPEDGILHSRRPENLISYTE